MLLQALSLVFLTLLLYVNTTIYVFILLLMSICYFPLWTASGLLQWTFCTFSLVVCMHFCRAVNTQLALWGHAVSMLISCRYCQFLKLTVPICTTPAMRVSPVLHISGLWNIIRICTIDILVYVQKYLMVEFDFSWWLMRLSTCSRDYLPFGHSLLLNTSSLARFMMSCVSFSFLVIF